MTPILAILSAISTAAAGINNTIGVGQWLVGYIRNRNRNRKAAEVLQWLKELGSASEADIRRLIAEWVPPSPVDASAREELAVLLINLSRTSRFHTTQGTSLSAYVRCERLIDQLLTNLEPKRRAGQPVGPGRKQWKLERFLGMGSFGEVWVGRNQHFPDRRAFKFFTIAGAKEWLRREGEALYHIRSRLKDCENVIRYEDIEVEAEPYPYLVLEFVEGGSLEDWILSPASERQPIPDTTELMAGVARGLAAAHRNKIYHRDLKPANVLLTDDPVPDPKVADFGLSRVEPETPSGSSALSQALVVGTRMYLPPEAADVYEARTPAQDDVFAFGVMWYQVLTGRIERPPYDFAERLHDDGTHSRTVRLLSRCLAHPSRRYRDAGELLADLEADAGPEVWPVPEGCFDVGPLAREYLDSITH